MSDSYQPIYDAVRSKISGGNIADAVSSAVRDAGIGFSFELIRRNAQEVLSQFERPSVLFRPTLGIDGNKWCALYGPNLAEGVAGFGDSASDAMYDFDRAWHDKLKVPGKCERCGMLRVLDNNRNCMDCVAGMARTNGD